MSAIRFIVQTLSARDRVNGHSYRAGFITSTASGKRLFVSDVGGDDNLRGTLGRLTGAETYPAVYSYVRDITRRELGRIERAQDANGRAPMEHEITAEMITALETPEVSE